MLNGKSIGVVVPAYNEERLIAKVLTTMPPYVDSIIVVNDASRDQTGAIVSKHAASDSRILLVTHETNKGLGQTLIDGYETARDNKVDIIAVMAGDAQMNPEDLINVVSPIAEGRADYVKGNRLLRDDCYERMPRHRFYGNSILTLLTKFATGYWNVIDPQCGYTAISLAALRRIPIATMTKGYGYNADILNMLNLNNFRVCDVEVEPVYGEEQSKIKLKTYIPKVSALLLRLFIKRMTHKYLVREFHPLVFLYIFSVFLLVIVTVPYSLNFMVNWIAHAEINTTMLIFLLNIFSTGIFSLVFGMWMDMEDNRKLIAPRG